MIIKNFSVQAVTNLKMKTIHKTFWTSIPATFLQSTVVYFFMLMLYVSLIFLPLFFIYCLFFAQLRIYVLIYLIWILWDQEAKPEG